MAPSNNAELNILKIMSYPPMEFVTSLRSPKDVAHTIMEKKRISGEFDIDSFVNTPKLKRKKIDAPNGKSANIKLYVIHLVNLLAKLNFSHNK